MESNKKLYRTTGNRVIAGVAGGVAEYLGISTPIVRIAFILLFFAGGGGGFLYLLLWAIAPRRPELSISFDTTEPGSEGLLGRLIKAGACAILMLIIGAIFSDDVWIAAFIIGLGIGLYWFWKSSERHANLTGERAGLHRSVANKKIFGVFGGLAEKWNIDPTILRAVGAVLVIAGAGVIIPIYILYTIIVPKGHYISSSTMETSSGERIVIV